ncbi:MAG: BamA/TamA family outer membrane protein [Bacteroidetes bacterium]|nr:BamA/TamA family outer membrane protein [Bacteroidota bacterium]MBS1540702.1 BamA/TamA family outer membrane protein [Bacteroidota bacterium]
MIRTFLPVLLLFLSLTAFGQQDTTDYSKQEDLIDLAEKVFKRNLGNRNKEKVAGKLYFSGAPSIGYSLTSGWSGLVAANGAFYTWDGSDAKISNIYSDAIYTQNKQFVAHLQSNIWTHQNKFNIVTDWRYYAYPQRTFGLGGTTDLNNYASQNFNYLRLYQTVMKSIRPNLYVGLGYGLDYHYHIVETDGNADVISNTLQYGLKSSSVSSGINASVLYDNRLNSINPAQGTYASASFRQNMVPLGSDANWQSLIVDLRHYIPFPCNSENILAFWSYNWLTLNGNPPYLDLPSTGWDPYGNIGRGYIQGRFRSKNLVYLEAEYRFKILTNGLIGGVVFANAQSVTQWPSNVFQSVAPAAGLGLRLKFNKYSRTNVAIDYGFGQQGSQGIFVNLGEVF